MKRWVFNSCLNLGVLSQFLIVSGRMFQWWGDVYEKACRPYLVCTCGTCSMVVSLLLRRSLLGLYSVSNDFKYWGPSWWIHLCVSSSNLKMHLWRTGNRMLLQYGETALHPIYASFKDNKISWPALCLITLIIDNTEEVIY